MGEDVTDVVVLMYHALYGSIDEFQSLHKEERPYAISIASFEKQIDGLIEAGVPILSPQDILEEEVQHARMAVLLTFDDGHRSFYEYAFPALSRRGLEAIFFVTTDLIHSREDFCSWTQLKEMTKRGMWIQSHGKTHRFLADLSPEESQLELSESKSQIEDQLGEKVLMLSFPGGRYKDRDIDIGKSLGYRYFFTSRVGANSWPELRSGFRIKRFPLKKTVSYNSLQAIFTYGSNALKIWQIRHTVKELGKTVLGNRIYHSLYRKLLS